MFDVYIVKSEEADFKCVEFSLSQLENASIAVIGDIAERGDKIFLF